MIWQNFFLFLQEVAYQTSLKQPQETNLSLAGGYPQAEENQIEENNGE